MSTLMLSLVSLSMTVSLVVSIVLCICRNKPKQTSSANNVNNLLPLNSIRSSDLQLESFRYNGVNSLVSDETDHHLRPHTQRALPDIPSLDPSQAISLDEYNLGSDRIKPFEEPQIDSKSRSSKGRAPPPPQPSHRVMTCPTVSANDVHHSYARIKDNAVIDSSENETDDYCDPQLCTVSVRNLSHNNEDLSPPLLQANRFTANNSELPFVTSNPSTSRTIDEPVLPFLSNPPVLLINPSNMEQYAQLNEENASNPNRTEISYNTISVREPLAKVLAERANSEHHYNEVEEERVSSFYEEIAGSTASSVTYSKIGDVLSDNTNRNEVRLQRELPAKRPVVQRFASDTTDSASTQPKHFANGASNNNNSFASKDYLKDLYSSVDKKSKKSYNRQTIHCVPDSDNEFDNLYAKVQKVNNAPKESSVLVNQRPSSVSEVEPDSARLGHNHPPPLPPPLKSSHSRSARTISLYDSYSSVPINTNSHQRSYSSGNQSITNDRNINNVEDYYDTVGANEMDLDNDPGYEVIQKKTSSANRTRQPIINHAINGVRSEFNTDPGYEAIGNDEFSDFDPNYEVIPKKVANRQMAEIVEPGYEVIKRVPQKHSTRFEISRNVSDVSSEPGYERIRFTQKSITIEQTEETDSEPNYAFICRRDGSHQSVDDDDEQIMSERL